MSPEYMEGRRSDRLPTVTSILLEGRSSLPSLNLIAALEASFDIVLGLFGIGRNATPSEIIINKLTTNRFQSVTILNKLSGKALTVRILPLTRAPAFNRLREMVQITNGGLLSA